MKLAITLTLLALLSTTPSANANHTHETLADQSEVIVRAMCGLLPIQEQVACLDQFSQYVGPNEDVLKVCDSMIFSDQKNACFDVATDTRYISKKALNMCSRQVFADSTISCLKKVKDVYFDSRAIDTCQKLVFADSQNRCVDAIANKHYTSAELNSCRGTIFENDTLSCLGRFGRKLNVESLRDQNITVVIPNNDRVDGRPSKRPAQRTCVVSNSTRDLGTIPAAQFAEYVRDEAIDNGKCVVAWIKGAEYSRAVVSGTGKVLGDNLSESQANSIKQSYGLNRCQVRSCTLQ